MGGGGEDYCTSADRFPLSHDLLVLPQQTFDIGVESNFNLWRRVSDLQKLETVVISGTAGFYYSAALTVAANACVVQSIKMVVLIRQSDLDLSLELSRYTTVGPHFEGDLVVRDVFKVSIKRYRELHGLAEVLKVVLLRLVRKCEEGEHLPRVLEGSI
jgi:hypothetical protein